MSRVMANIATNLVFAVISAIVGLVSTLVMARQMDVDAFGFVMVLLIAFNSISALDGLRPVVVYESAGETADRYALYRIAVGMAVALSLIVVLTTSLIVGILALDRLTWPGVVLFAVALGLYFPMSVYWGMLDAAGFTIFTGSVRSVAWTIIFVMFAIFAFFDASATSYAAAFAAMNATLLIVFRVVMPPIPATGFTSGKASMLAWRLLRQSASNVSFNLSALIMGSVDRVVLSASAGMNAVGLYSGAYELATKPAALFRVVTLVLFPEAARSKAGSAKLAFVWARATAYSFATVSIGVAFAVALRDRILIWVLGSKFAEVVDAFGLLLIGFSLVVLGYACAVILNARGNFSLQRNCYGFAAVAMACLAWPLTRYGIIGTAVLYLVSRLVDAVLLYFTARMVGVLPATLTIMMICMFYAGLMFFAWIGWYFWALLLWFMLAWALRRWVVEAQRHRVAPT